MKRYRIIAAFAALAVCAALVLTPVQATAAGLPMTTTASSVQYAYGSHGVGEFAGAIWYDDGTYYGTLYRNDASLSIYDRQYVWCTAQWQSTVPWPTDNGLGAAQATDAPGAVGYYYYDGASGQNVYAELGKQTANYFGGSVEYITITAHHDGYMYDPDNHSTLGYMSNNTSTYMGNNSYNSTPRKPNDYYGPNGQENLGWIQVGRKWAGDLQDATQEPWRSLCLVESGKALFDAQSNGSNNRYRKPVWIDYERYAPTQYVYADYGGYAALKMSAITYSGTVTRRNSGPSTSISASSYRVNPGQGFTIYANSSDPDGDDLLVTVSWQYMGMGNNAPGASGTEYSGWRGSGSALQQNGWTWYTSGYYRAWVTATDPGGLSSTSSMTIYVNSGPSITLSSSNNRPNVGQSFTITSTPADPDGDNLTTTVTWQYMGMGNNSPGAVNTLFSGSRTSGSTISLPGTVFNQPGYYKFAASASDGGGLADSKTLTIYVNGQPTAGIVCSPDTVSDDVAECDVNVTLTDPDGDNLVTTVTWQPLGADKNTPGTVITIYSGTRSSGSNFSLHQTGLIPGWYKATVTVKDSGNLSATASSTVNTIITNIPPVVTLTPDRASYVEGDTANVAVRCYDRKGDQLEVTVTWQDLGELGAAPQPLETVLHQTYPSKGSYTIPQDIQFIAQRAPMIPHPLKLTVTARDPGGLSDTKTTILNTVPKPIDGQVVHTDQWEVNRLDYDTWANRTGHPEKVRPVELFFRGERFVLKAQTSRYLRSNQVQVQIVEHPEYNTLLTSTDGYNWTGYLWGAEMFEWPAQSLTFIFRNQYIDGTVTSDTVVVRIDKEDYYKIRMTY